MSSKINNFVIVSIEGNIGSGKTTLLGHIKDHFKGNDKIVFVREPVDEWEKIKDKDGNTMLQKFYKDQMKYSFAFQMMAYVSRLKILRETINNVLNDPDNRYIIITERCLYTDRYVFAKMLYDGGFIEDVCYQIYLSWFDEFIKDYSVNYIVYVNTLPNICHDRIHERARTGEDIIPLDYLTNCHKYHNDYLFGMDELSLNVLELNGNINIFENSHVLNDWISNIIAFTGIDYCVMCNKL